MNKTQAIDLLLSEPVAPGSVIQLQIFFSGNPKTYNYAAIEVNGLWYLTGTDGTGRTWAELVVWMKSKNANVASIQLATEWEKL